MRNCRTVTALAATIALTSCGAAHTAPAPATNVPTTAHSETPVPVPTTTVTVTATAAPDNTSTGASTPATTPTAVTDTPETSADPNDHTGMTRAYVEGTHGWTTGWSDDARSLTFMTGDGGGLSPQGILTSGFDKRPTKIIYDDATQAPKTDAQRRWIIGEPSYDMKDGTVQLLTDCTLLSVNTTTRDDGSTAEDDKFNCQQGGATTDVEVAWDTTWWEKHDPGSDDYEAQSRTFANQQADGSTTTTHYNLLLQLGPGATTPSDGAWLIDYTVYGL